jgi:alkyl sulfatase BDS1-like metallo-beta-lactamase superfamily hydrolase
MEGIQMKRSGFRTQAAVLPVVLLLCAGCMDKEAPNTMDVAANTHLSEQTAEFKQGVVEVTDGVYVAIGFGLANSVLVEGEDGVVIVDTMESAEAAVPVKAAFDRITSKPVKAIIYTHFHSDHTFGARVMAGDDHPDVYSHESTLYHLNRIVNITRETTYRRAMRQFGTLLPHGGLINAGIGPRLVFTQESTPAVILPNKTFAGERLDLEVAGIRLVLMHAPGETPDQILVWLPDEKVLLPADNFYKAFPNLYAIRGTAYRDVTLWVNSLDRMRALGAEYMVPQHTRPVTGAREIYETLTNYRDAIQFVHDQTIRWMNKGLTPDQIVERVKLPGHLASLPYLQEYYGTVAWSVRAIFDGYMGWFGGNATNLFPLTVRKRAERYAKLAGGKEVLLRHAGEAVEEKDFQWALELTDHLMALDPDLAKARGLKSKALTALAQEQVSAPARNYYLTQALELEGKVKIGMLKVEDKEMLHGIPLSGIFQAMAVKLDPEKSADVNRIVGFRFPDTGETFCVHVRRGVAEVRPELSQGADNVITTDSHVWKEIAAGVRNPALAYVKGDVQIEGGKFELVKFLGLFKDDE